jgi:hypothetical protein
MDWKLKALGILIAFYILWGFASFFGFSLALSFSIFSQPLQQMETKSKVPACKRLEA